MMRMDSIRAAAVLFLATLGLLVVVTTVQNEDLVGTDAERSVLAEEWMRNQKFGFHPDELNVHPKEQTKAYNTLFKVFGGGHVIPAEDALKDSEIVKAEVAADGAERQELSVGSRTCPNDPMCTTTQAGFAQPLRKAGIGLVTGPEDYGEAGEAYRRAATPAAKVTDPMAAAGVYDEENRNARRNMPDKIDFTPGEEHSDSFFDFSNPRARFNAGFKKGRQGVRVPDSYVKAKFGPGIAPFNVDRNMAASKDPFAGDSHSQMSPDLKLIRGTGMSAGFRAQWGPGVGMFDKVSAGDTTVFPAYLSN